MIVMQILHFSSKDLGFVVTLRMMDKNGLGGGCGNDE